MVLFSTFVSSWIFPTYSWFNSCVLLNVVHLSFSQFFSSFTFWLSTPLFDIRFNHLQWIPLFTPIGGSSFLRVRWPVLISQNNVHTVSQSKYFFLSLFHFCPRVYSTHCVIQFQYSYFRKRWLTVNHIIRIIILHRHDSCKVAHFIWKHYWLSIPQTFWSNFALISPLITECVGIVSFHLLSLPMENCAFRN